MEATLQLQQLKGLLESQIFDLQLELDTIDKTIKILERENPGTSPPLTLPGGMMPASVPQSVVGIAEKGLGLSDLCRKIMGDSWKAPLDVRDALIALGYPNPDKGKLLSSVFATLKRMQGAGEMESRKTSGRMEFHKRSKEIQAA